MGAFKEDHSIGSIRRTGESVATCRWKRRQPPARSVAGVLWGIIRFACMNVHVALSTFLNEVERRAAFSQLMARRTRVLNSTRSVLGSVALALVALASPAAAQPSLSSLEPWGLSWAMESSGWAAVGAVTVLLAWLWFVRQRRQSAWSWSLPKCEPQPTVWHVRQPKPEEAGAGGMFDEAAFRSVFASAPIGMLAVDTTGRIVMINKELERLFGYTQSELEGQQLELLLPERFRDQHAEHRKLYATAPRNRPMGLGMDLWAKRKDGTEFPVEVSLSTVNSGDRQLAVAFVVDISSRKQVEDELAMQVEALGEAKAELEHANRRLAHDVMHDSLTGLPNRALLMNRLERAIQRLKRGTVPGITVLFLDFDDFKVVNDTHGHGIGDQLLVAIGRRLRAFLRPADTVARLGGDEFAVILDSIGTCDEAVEVTERLRKGLSRPFLVKRLKLRVAVSMGLVCCEDRDMCADDILQIADQAMYQAKAAGKGRHHVINVSKGDREKG